MVSSISSSSSSSKDSLLTPPSTSSPPTFPAPPASYQHTPFPDVSGLRTDAPGRAAYVSSSTDDLTELIQVACAIEEARGWQSGTILAAAWAAILTHYIYQEDVEIEFHVVTCNALARAVKICGPNVTGWGVSELCSCVTVQLENTTKAQNKYSPDTSLSFRGINYDDSHQAQEGWLADRAVAIHADSKRFHLSAAGRVHSQESASLQLRQLEGYFRSFIAELQDDGEARRLPACDAARLPDDLRAGDNPHPQQASLPDGSPLNEELFHHQFERQARSHPNAIAFDFRFDLDPTSLRNVQWSYAELNRRATLVQAKIEQVDRNVGSDTIIALCLSKSPEMYVAQLGILKAGAAWCPIDPDWPQQRQQALLLKSEAKVLLAAGRTVCDSLSSILPQGMHLLRLDHIDWTEEIPKSQPAANGVAKSQKATPASLAYKIWTSGTTGLPKAVGIEHRSAVQALLSLQQVIPHNGSQIRYLQFSAYVFDLSILDCFYTWGLGGTLCSASRQLLLDDLVGIANAFQASHSLLTPAVMAMTPRESIPSLQVVINGGEKLTQVVADTWSNDCCLLNLYGPAEATLIAMHRRVPPCDNVKAPNIGVALPTVSCHALDRNGTIVPKGAIGQLALGGFQCARGYLGDVEKTAEKFLDHPSLGRIYLTGDLVRQLADQSFEYLGREDDQIKINGIRIETLEISAVIKNSHPDIKDSETQAISIDDEPEQMRIVNFSVLPQPGNLKQHLLRVDQDAAAVAQSLRSAAQKALPSYMVPSLFLIVNYFPRTSSAKIDRVALRSALRALDITQWEAAIAGQAAESSNADGDYDHTQSPEAELAIRRLVSELCNIHADRIGRTTPFPSLGLDSIKAMMLARKLTNVGFPTSVVDIVEYASLAQLARKISKTDGESLSSSRVQDSVAYLTYFDGLYRPAVVKLLQVDTTAIESISPLTPLQEGMLAETLRNPDHGSYWLNRKYLISARVDSTSLQKAIENIVDMTSGCRTSFCEAPKLRPDTSVRLSQSSFVQLVRNDLIPSVSTVTLSADCVNHDEQLLTAAKGLTGSNPVTGRSPLAFVIGEDPKRLQSYLLVRAHHSIYDARSLELLEEMINAQIGSGSSCVDQPAAMTMALPFILPLTEEEERARLQCWEDALRVVPKPLASTAFPNLSGQSSAEAQTKAHFDRVSMVSSVTWSEVSLAAKRMGTSARPIAQCAWASVLAAYLGSEYILLGDSVSGRAIGPDLDNVFGPLHATVPVPIVVKPDTIRREMVDRVDDFHKSILHHQHVPLSFVRRQLEVRPDESLFQSVFVFETSTKVSQKHPVLIHSKDLELSVEHPLAVEISTDSEGTLSLGIVHRNDTLSSQQASLMLHQLNASLSSFCSSPEGFSQDWSTSSFLEGNEERLLSISKPRPSASIDCAIDTPVEAWLSRNASHHPELPALEFWSSLDPQSKPEILSYRQLDQMASAFASFLLEKLSPQAIVAVCLSRCVMTYTSLLAIQRAGLIYLPIDENLPVERQQLLVQESGATCVLTEQQFSGQFQNGAAEVFDVHDVDLAPYMHHRLNVISSPSDLSYLLYTSGSTGKPKGCKLTRSNLSAAIEAFRLTFEIEAPGTFLSGARFLARSAEAFDVALLEVFLPLRTASTIVTGPRSLILEDMRKAMTSMRVTHAAVVPSLFFSEGARIRPEHLPDLRALIVGGEQIPTDIVKIWGGSHIPTLNAYGPTEATIGISIARVLPNTSTRNVGRAFPGSQYAVMVDKDGQLCPALRGQAGELCIIGPQVGKGYLGQDQPPAFTTWRNQPLYRTGDLARLTIDDEALYLGRIDTSQVKIRGARLELGEVDAALSGAVQDQKLHIASIHLKSEDRLVSFAARSAGPQASDGAEIGLDYSLADALKVMWRTARTSLPSHMRPSAIVPLLRLPLASISGKVDTRALRCIFEELGDKIEGLVAEANSEESRTLTSRENLIVEELQQVVARPKGSLKDVRPSSDLFALGLDSLSAVRLAGRLRQRGLDISVSALLSSASLEEVAAKESGSPTSASHTNSHSTSRLFASARQIGLVKGDDALVYPCTPLQESLIAETLSTPLEKGQNIPYISSILTDLEEPIDETRLVSAILETISANPIWRTCFAEIEGKLCQIVQSDSAGTIWMPEGEELDPVQLIKDIATVPPVRMQLQRSDTGARQLLILAHHSLYDGISLDLFKKDVELRYSGKSVILRNSFEDATAFINAQSEETAKVFWLSQLEDFSLTPFPSLHPLRLGQATHHKETSLTSCLSHSELGEISSLFGVTLQALLVTAWSSFFEQFTGESDALFGLVLSGRSIDLDDAENIHGPLITTIPFRTAPPKTELQTLESRVRATHRRLLASYPYQHTSLRNIGRWLQLDAPLFNALFTFLAPSSEQSSSIFQNTIATMQTEYPIAVEVQTQHDDTMQLRLVYDPHFIPERQAELLLRQLDEEIQCLATVPKGQVHEPSLELRSISNATPYIPTRQDHFLHRFKQQVHRRPDAVALDFATNGLHAPCDSLTYQQLDKVSDMIAATLAEHGPDSTLAVYMHRSTTFYATVLAVWKVGATYLPLDPTLPFERLKYMLEVAVVSTIVADQACVDISRAMVEKVILIEIASQVSDAPFPLTARALDLERPAYVLFTSGSTGNPKGVPISHQALAAAIFSWESILPHQDNSRMLQLASASFDVSLIEICLPWAFGCAVVSAPKDVLLDDLEEAFRKLRVTMADLPSSLAPTVHPENVPKLEWLMSGGDAIDERVLREWGSHALINAWGPTETTIGNALGFVSKQSKRSIVGTAWPGSAVYVLQSDSVDIAYRGAVGELAVAGPQLSEGYLGRPDLTAAAFVRLADGTRVYRTGDRGRMLADGQIEVLGRVSRGQVKLRGQRLELHEVSHAFLTVSEGQVQDADTLFLQHPSLPAKQLITWLALKDCKTTDQVTIRTDLLAKRVLRHCIQEVSRKLPAYMIPSHVLIASGSLPLTANNKVDHRALEKAFLNLKLKDLQDADEQLEDRETRQLWSHEEKRLRDIIASFCEVPSEDILRTTSFYRLGIDSLSAIRLARSIKEANIFLHLSAKDILRWPNVALLAANSSGRREDESNAQVRSSAMDDVKSHEVDRKNLLLSPEDEIVSLLPCTPLQEGTIAQTLATDGRLYLHHHAYRIQKNTTVEAICAAWHAVIDSTYILRTTFHRSSNAARWLQAVHKSSVPSHQLRILETGNFVQAWEHLTSTPMTTTEEDFAKPIARLTVVVCPTENIIVLSLHHALYDGNALPKLISDIDDAIDGKELRDRLPFYQLVPHLLPNSADSRFWAEHLNGYSAAPLPRRRSSSDNSACDATLEIDLPLHDARSFARSLEVSLRTVAVASFAKALCGLSSRRDIVFGQIFALRNSIEGADEVIGPAFNTIPTRVKWGRSQTVADVLKTVQEDSDAGQPHRHASLRDIQTRLKLEEVPFDALLDYQIQEETGVLKNLSPASPPAEPSIQYAVNLEFRQMKSHILLFATANTSVLLESELQAFLHNVANVFKSFLLNPGVPADGPPSELPVPSDEETPATSTLERKPRVAFPEDDENPTWSALEMKIKAHVLAVVRCPEERLTPSTSLFSLGIDSVSAIHLAGLIRRGGSPIAVSDIIKGASIRGLAKRIEERLQATSNEVQAPSPRWTATSHIEDAVRSKLDLDAQSIECIQPALPGQAFQLARWLNSSKRLGIYSWTWLLEERVDEKALQNAWSALLKRQSILRTTFAVVDGEPFQVILRYEATNVNVAFSEVKESQTLEDAGKQKLRELADVPADMKRPPANLCVLLQAERSLIVLNLSHALYDAWSIELIADDLQKLYTGQEPLSNPTFSDFVERHVALSSGTKSSEEAKTFWVRELQGAQPTLLPKKKEHRGMESQKDMMLFVPDAIRIARAYQEIRRRCTRSSLPSLQALFMASWAKELSLLTGNPRPLFGVYHSGRSDDFPDIEHLAGPCLSVLPILTNPQNTLDSSTSTSTSTSTCSSKSQLVDQAREFEAALARRSGWEQRTDLKSIHEWMVDSSPSFSSSSTSTSNSTSTLTSLKDGGKGPLFDTYLNLIWGTSTSRDSSSDGSSDQSPEKAKRRSARWKALKLGHPVDFLPLPPPPSPLHPPSAEESSSTKSTIEDLSRSYLESIQPKLEVDIVLQEKEDGDCIDVGIRCDADVDLTIPGADADADAGDGDGADADAGAGGGELWKLVLRLCERVKRCVEELQIDLAGSID